MAGKGWIPGRPQSAASNRRRSRTLKGRVKPSAVREKLRTAQLVRPENDPEVVKRRRFAYLLKKLYGITVENFEQARAAQNGRCYFCLSVPKAKRLAVDHDHVTMRFRGLLCPGCNRCLGWFEKYRDAVLKYLDEEV